MAFHPAAEPGSFMGENAGHLQLLRDVAPIISAAVAIVAGSIAYVAIQVQRQIARRRATLDFFIKTDLDSSNFEIAKLETFQKMAPSAAIINQRITANHSYAAISDDPHYKVVESYLNIHELLAVGIHHEVLDEMICFDYWRDALLGHFNDATPIIEIVRAQPGNESAYDHLEGLYHRWVAMSKLFESRRKTNTSSHRYWRARPA